MLGNWRLGGWGLGNERLGSWRLDLDVEDRQCEQK